MSDASLHNATHENEAQFGDYFALLKPRVMTLVVFTAVVGLLAAPFQSIRCRIYRDFVHRAGRWCLGCIEHVV